MPIQKVCEQCGAGFQVKPRDAAQRFCRRDCKTAHEAANGRPSAHKAPATFQCKQCGNPFTMMPGYLNALRKKHGRDPLYCSIRCMGEAKKLTTEGWSKSCIQCGKPMPIQRRPGGTINRQKELCSTECRSMFRRLSYQTKHPQQGVSEPRKYKNGYLRVVVPGKNGEPSREVFHHRYVMEQHMGRRLFPGETVHHINGDRANNDLSNLELFSSRHGPGQRVVDKVRFAIEILRLYPEFAHAEGVALVEHEISGDPACSAHGTPSAPH